MIRDVALRSDLENLRAAEGHLADALNALDDVDTSGTDDCDELDAIVLSLDALLRRLQTLTAREVA